MRQDYTHIAIALDSSGSMDAILMDTIGGFNTLLKGQREAEGFATLSLADFTGINYDGPVYRNFGHASNGFNRPKVILQKKIDFVDVKEVKDLTTSTYIPAGGTPLLDLVDKMIDDTGARLAAMPEATRPAKVLFVIITDGEENASVVTNYETLKAKILHQTEAFKWQFQYIGANQDAIKVGSAMGIAPAMAMNYTADAAGTQATYSTLTSKMAAYRSSSVNANDAIAVAASLNFNAEDRAKSSGGFI